jgi:4a-hydroxytetrahydrobiopterin dehydratase
MSRLSDEEIAAGVEGTPWSREDDAIMREASFEDFEGAVAFVNDVAEAAEAANHHPDILVHDYNQVRLTLSTHSEGGITDADLELARTIDGLT